MIPNGLAKEAWLINNPALGGYMLWIFAKECFDEKPEAIHPSKLFCLFPFLYYADTRVVLSKATRTNNLHSFVSKFSTTKACASDTTLTIHLRVDEQKEKTLESLITAFDSGLLLLDTETGLITPNMAIKSIKRPELDETTKELFDCSRRLGKWFAHLSMEDITRTIKVVF